LALLEKPFSDEALKRLARALRELVENNGGKFVCTRTGCIDFSGTSASAAVFGPALDMEIPDLFYPPCLAGNILRRFSPLVLGAALLHNKQPPPALSAFPPLSFRAAALANMSCRPLDGNGMENPYSLEWKIGALRWLPAAGKTKS
jgi:hypothetical protein